MGNVSIRKLGLILVLLLCVTYLVQGFRLIQEKGKSDKPKKIDTTEKDDTVKEKYTNQTVTVHFKIPPKLEESAKYDAATSAEKNPEVVKPKIVIAKKPNVDNDTKIVLDKSEKLELTEKIKAKLLENIEKDAKQNITKIIELKKISKTEKSPKQEKAQLEEQIQKPIVKRKKEDIIEVEDRKVSDEIEATILDVGENFQKPNITKLLEIKKISKTTEKDRVKENKIIELVNDKKELKTSSDKAKSNLLEKAKSKLIDHEDKSSKLNVTKILEIKKTSKLTEKETLSESVTKKKIQDDKVKDAVKLSPKPLVSEIPPKIITSIVRKAKENETTLPSVKEAIKQKIEASKILSSKFAEDKTKEEPYVKEVIKQKIEASKIVSSKIPEEETKEEVKKLSVDKIILSKTADDKSKTIKETQTVDKKGKIKKEDFKKSTQDAIKSSATKQNTITSDKTRSKDVSSHEKTTKDKDTTKIRSITEKKLKYDSVPVFTPNFDVIQNEECRNQGFVVMEQMKNHKLWALRMFDASAKIPSGILKGNLNQLGDYDQCLGIHAKVPPVEGEVDEKEMRISGKYCLAAIDIAATIQEMKLPVNLAQGRAFIRSKNSDPGHFIPRFTTIQWGLCVPSVCTAEDVQNSLEYYLKKNDSVGGVKFNVLVEPDQCHVRKPPRILDDLKYETIATIGLLTMIVVTTVVATLRDLVYIDENENGDEKPKTERIFMSFSLKRTLKSFLQDPENDDINCIHGVRAICTLLLYIAHKLIPVGHSPYTNKILLTEVSNHPLSILLRMSVIYTDSFLLLSGILTAYHMSRDMESRGHIPWVNRIFARLIRLTPTLLIVLLYYAYVMDMTGEGPLWSTVVEQNAKLCQENWWKNLIYIQNIYPFEEMCATHTHQLALDMQLFLVAPILVWFLYRRPFLGVFTTLLLHSLSVILRYYTTLNYRLSLVIYHGISISQLYRTANLLYASTLHRATPYVAGVGLGVLLRQLNPEFRMPKVLAVTGWLMTGYFISWTFYTPSHLSSRTYVYDVHEAAQYAALCSLAWALALSWIIFASYTNYDGYLNTILSSRPMVLLSKLSYTMYLTQFIVFFYNVGILRRPSEFHITKILNISELIVVISFSIILLLLVDLPVQKIKNILMKPAKKSQKSEASSEIDTKPRSGSSATQSEKSDSESEKFDN